MIRHLIKMVWNRKRWNFLILVEMFLSFLVVFAVAVSGMSLYMNQKRPNGFDYSDVWLLSLNTPQGAMDEENQATTLTQLKQIEQFLLAQPEILAQGLMNTPPYQNANWSSSFIGPDKVKARTYLSYCTLGLKDALDITIKEGRWFQEGDFQVGNPTPVVINGLLAEKLAPNESALGFLLHFNKEETSEEYRVVGITENFRKEGELKKPLPFSFLPFCPDKEIGWLPQYGLLEMASGTTAAFEESLVAQLNGLAPDWSFKTQPLSRERSNYIAKTTRNVKIMGLVAFFLILMVVMGLIGVLWQHVTRRTIELGVRRAKGATKAAIYSQILGEFLVVATLAILLGLICLIQLPMIGILKPQAYNVFIPSFFLSALVLYSLTLISAWYPGWMASKIPPAEALHYE